MTPFLNVNGESVNLQTALQWASLAGDQALEKRTIQNAVIVQYAAKNGIKASKADMQTVFDELRYAMGLESAEAMTQWMKERNFDLKAMQEFCEITSIRNKMRAAITDAQIRERYAEVQTKSETVDLYAIFLPTEDQAKELKAQAEEGESFLALAKEHSTDADTARQGGFIGSTSRGSLDGAVEAAAFGGKEGDIIGPFKTEKEYAIYQVGKHHKPTLEEAAFALREAMFEETIHDLAEKAEVEQVVLKQNINPFAEESDEESDED